MTLGGYWPPSLKVEIADFGGGTNYASWRFFCFYFSCVRKTKTFFSLSCRKILQCSPYHCILSGNLSQPLTAHLFPFFFLLSCIVFFCSCIAWPKQCPLHPVCGNLSQPLTLNSTPLSFFLSFVIYCIPLLLHPMAQAMSIATCLWKLITALKITHFLCTYAARIT